MKPDHGSAPLRPDQTQQAVRALARAFHDDPGSVWLLPNPGKRRRFLRRFFERQVRYARLYGEAYTGPDGVTGAAIWLPPDQPFFTPSRLLSNGFLALPFKLGPIALIKALASMTFFERLHRKDVAERHWYLAVLGVDPAYQGQGVGGSTIQPVLERADREGLPCYLETGKEINVRFYRQHGFEVVAEGFAPLGGPRYWTMRRDPIG